MGTVTSADGDAVSPQVLQIRAWNDMVNMNKRVYKLLQGKGICWCMFFNPCMLRKNKLYGNMKPVNDIFADIVKKVSKRYGSNVSFLFGDWAYISNQLTLWGKSPKTSKLKFPIICLLFSVHGR